nr:septum formation initiator family protein [Halomonas socia]
MLKWLAIVLVGLTALLQYQLWFGDGGVAELADIRARADALEAQNVPLRARNARLAAEVIDLQTGLDAIEERGRSDIGMVRADEQFYWVPGVVAESAIVEQRALQSATQAGEEGAP